MSHGLGKAFARFMRGEGDEQELRAELERSGHQEELDALHMLYRGSACDEECGHCGGCS